MVRNFAPRRNVPLETENLASDGYKARSKLELLPDKAGRASAGDKIYSVYNSHFCNVSCYPRFVEIDGVV